MAFPPKTKAAHHRGTFHQASIRCRAQAYANWATRCRRCGKTLDEVRATKPNATWTAGHVNDGEIGGALQPECSPCSTSSGARLANQRARANQLRKQRTDYTW